MTEKEKVQLLYLEEIYPNWNKASVCAMQQVELAKVPRVPDHLQEEVPQRGPLSCLGVVLERSRLLCLQRYEKELFSENAYLEYYRRCHERLTREQLAIFAGVFNKHCHVMHGTRAGHVSIVLLLLVHTYLTRFLSLAHT